MRRRALPLWREAEQHLFNDQPYTFLRRSKSLVFIDRRLRNVVNTKVGLNLGQVPLENYVPAVEQRYTH